VAFPAVRRRHRRRSIPKVLCAEPNNSNLFEDIEDASIEVLRHQAAFLRNDRKPENWSDLAEEMAWAEAAYITAAVTEIASFRAQLSGPQVG